LGDRFRRYRAAGVFLAAATRLPGNGRNAHGHAAIYYPHGYGYGYTYIYANRSAAYGDITPDKHGHIHARSAIGNGRFSANTNTFAADHNALAGHGNGRARHWPPYHSTWRYLLAASGRVVRKPVLLANTSIPQCVGSLLASSRRADGYTRRLP